ncbi:MAG: ABC transporter substrate-binding protein [Pseudonocardiaceae bacterium]
MRLRTVLAALLTCATMLVGCSSGSVGSGVSPTALELQVAIPADTTNVEGDRANLGVGSPNAGIYETLLTMDNQLQVRPGLAERYEFIAPNTWRFTLRKGVKFHDGSELTAEDVVFTFDRYGRIGGQYIKAQEGGTKAVDRHTVDFTASVPNRRCRPVTSTSSRTPRSNSSAPSRPTTE